MEPTFVAEKWEPLESALSTPTVADDGPKRQRSQALLAVLGGQNVLFSPAHQKIYRLNDVAAYIWRCIEDEMDFDAILDEMVRHGIDADLAGMSVRSALHEWTRLGLIGTFHQPRLPQTADAPCLCQEVQLAGLQVRIRYSTTRATFAASIFRHLEHAGQPPDVLLDVCEEEDHFRLLRNNRWIESCSAEELAASLKAQLLIEVLECGRYELALHTASLIHNESVLLICGKPGAGKTTLSLALEHAGFAIAGDDLALLDATGLVTGVPFPVAVKAGAWKLVTRYRSDVTKAPVSRRSDRKRVRYLTPLRLVRSSARPVSWVVMLRRRSGKDVSLRPIGPIEALEGLLKDAFAAGHELSPPGFEALVSLVNRAKSFCLTYSRLEDAVKLLRDACR